MKLLRALAVTALMSACSGGKAPAHPVAAAPVAAAPAPAPAAPVAPIAAKTLTIIGTNDLHGALIRLPLLAGYVANARAARAADGGAVLLVDAGDLFQGTLESNLAEGADVVRAYNQMGYAATAIGNHEFDYGPEGPAATVNGADEDPRGALKARAKEAKFPFLVTNIADKATGKLIDWPNVAPSTLVTVDGLNVGIVGASTASTPFTTMAANFAGLEMKPTAADAIIAAAKDLRGRGADVVVVIAHIGGTCKDFEHPDNLASCDHSEEVFDVVTKLPAGLVDVFVAGHTHAIVAHRINNVAVIESLSFGRAFGRVDLEVTAKHVTKSTIHPPQLVCPLDEHQNPVPLVDCHPAAYEGKPVVADPAVQQIVDGALERAGERRREKLGVSLTAIVTKAYGKESVEGDWITDLMLAARPDADVALTNGGGLRQDIAAGELTYGQLFEAMPFDNRFAIVTLKGEHVRRLVESNLRKGGGILSWGGLHAKARCKGDKLVATIEIKGKPLVDKATYHLATSDFLASGGDGLLGRLHLPAGSIRATDVIIRDAVADVLRKRAGTKGSTIDPKAIFTPAHARLDYEGERPVKCGDAAAEEGGE